MELTYPPELPISDRAEEIRAAIAGHQVVIVAGETGSGKTTQLPKMCLQLGRAADGSRIGHTQPRRIAARAVAERLAEEMRVPLGSQVGYAVRFTDRVSDDTRVKVMTDGILLAEIQRDRDLHRYDTLIIDEAHERSLNIDFLLGYLTRLLPRRPDLKLIITSATIDTARFAAHFGGAPVVEVSGRTYPVEIRYRPLVADAADGGPRDQTQAICDAVTELGAERGGDVLVFLSGEREIRDTAEALQRMSLRDTEILPLYARLSAAEQHRVFTAHGGRRIVLATNVAETSLTVPGIRYVVDPGTARISRYSRRLKVQRLPIEPVSQASADQRAGRCGRLADGICIRLYAEEDLAGRAEFTEPEILRTNLASVILQMAALGLGDVAAFPFVQPPDSRSIADGVQLLEELGALRPARRGEPVRLTALGRKLARLPVDPRLARMVLEADRNGCVAEVVAIAAALSIQDPRERPAEAAEAADQQHARFTDPGSDFLGHLNLWRYIGQQQAALSSSAFRRMCRREFLNYLRIREWQDVEGQLRQTAKRMGITPNRAPAPDPARIHASLLAGLLSQIGARDGDTREYAGARGARFAIFGGSALARRPPRWVMAAQLVETTRLWARVTAPIEPEWAEKLAGHLVKRSFSEPHWERKRAGVVAVENVTLYGVPIVAGRKVAYGSIDPELSRDLFIRHALVEGDWHTNHRFFHENRRLLEGVEELEARTRRRDLLVDDETLFAFYDGRIPPDVVSGAHFDRWWKGARRERPDLLSFWTSMLTTPAVADVDHEDYPDSWRQGDLELPVRYAFEPGSASDGVSVRVPLAVLNRVRPDGFDWQVPGLRQELVTALLRSLPKHLRRELVPVPDRATALLQRISPADGPLLGALAGAVQQTTGVTIGPKDWDAGKVPEHLQMIFDVVDDAGTVVASSTDLAELQRRLRPRVNRVLSGAGTGLERRGLRSWPQDLVELPRQVQDSAVLGFPALVDCATAVDVQLLGTRTEQHEAMRAGTRRLLSIAVPSPTLPIGRALGNRARLVLARAPYRDVAALLDDCVLAAIDALVAEHGGPAWDAGSFAALRSAVAADLPERARRVVEGVQNVMEQVQEVEVRLARTDRPALLDGLSDAREQLSGLVFGGFVGTLGAGRLPDLRRYLAALVHRLDRLGDRPARDADLLATFRRVAAECAGALAALPAARRDEEDARQVRWMLEEFRVSLFAPGIRTAYPVSEQRIRRALAGLVGRS